MLVYVQICIDDVEVDADLMRLANNVVRQVQENQPFHTVTLDSVEAQCEDR